jgi:hypothetical protein
MSRAIPDATACREALSRLPTLEIRELRKQWRSLYKTQAPPNLSRELLLRAVAYRMQEVALGGLRPARQRQLRQVAQQFKQTGAANTPARPAAAAGTGFAPGSAAFRLMHVTRDLARWRNCVARLSRCPTYRRPRDDIAGHRPAIATRLARPRVGAFWKPGDPALISLPGPAWPGAR